MFQTETVFGPKTGQKRDFEPLEMARDWHEIGTSVVTGIPGQRRYPVAIVNIRGDNDNQVDLWICHHAEGVVEYPQKNNWCFPVVLSGAWPSGKATDFESAERDGETPVFIGGAMDDYLNNLWRVVNGMVGCAAGSTIMIIAITGAVALLCIGGCILMMIFAQPPASFPLPF